MKVKYKYFLSYLIIPLVTIIVALIGSYFTTSGMNWYDTEIIKPELTPPKWVFPVAWNTIFILTTISVLIFWNRSTRDENFKLITLLFIANAFFNIFWSFLFFNQHLILLSFLEMIILELTLIALIILLYKISKLSSWLLLPYALWVAFASFLTFQIFNYN